MAARHAQVSRTVGHWLEMTRLTTLQQDPAWAVLGHQIRPDIDRPLVLHPDPATPPVSDLLCLLVDACPQYSSLVSQECYVFACVLLFVTVNQGL